MRILFVHGLGATPFDWFPTFLRLKRLGYKTSTFSYFASFQKLDAIKQRLRNQLVDMASQGDYAVIGHSLGGVLLREVLQSMPSGAPPPKRLFLLGSPVNATQVNRYLNRFALYRIMFGQCGQLVASQQCMDAIGIPGVPTTCVVGINGSRSRYFPLGAQANDGLVLESELRTDLFSDVVRIAATHPFLPASRHVWPIIHHRLCE
jgi:hypothetical protein